MAMLRGRRYILTPPTSCAHLNLIRDRKHPSFRHSGCGLIINKRARRFRPKARGAIDTVLREGERASALDADPLHHVPAAEIQSRRRRGRGGSESALQPRGAHAVGAATAAIELFGLLRAELCDAEARFERAERNEERICESIALCRAEGRRADAASRRR